MMRTAMTERVTVGAIAVATIFAFLSAPASAQEKVWKHGLINAKSDAGIFLMVSTRDFAKKQGIKIEISQFKDDQLALKALIAGELDSFEGGPQGVFAADSKGGDVKLLGCHWVVVPHGIYANEKITKVEDLKGKQIAVSAPNSMPDMLARSALAKFGVADTEVKLAAVGGDNDRYQALIGGVVDAAVVSNEYQPVAPKNIHLLVAGRDAVPNFLRVCMVSTGKKLAERGDAGGQFELGMMFFYGQGVPQSDQEAAVWFRKAAEQGCAEAQAALVICTPPTTVNTTPTDRRERSSGRMGSKGRASSLWREMSLS